MNNDITQLKKRNCGYAITNIKKDKKNYPSVCLCPKPGAWSFIIVICWHKNSFFFGFEQKSSRLFLTFELFYIFHLWAFSMPHWFCSMLKAIRLPNFSIFYFIFSLAESCLIDIKPHPFFLFFSFIKLNSFNSKTSKTLAIIFFTDKFNFDSLFLKNAWIWFYQIIDKRQQ